MALAAHGHVTEQLGEVYYCVEIKTGLYLCSLYKDAKKKQPNQSGYKGLEMVQLHGSKL